MVGSGGPHGAGACDEPRQTAILRVPDFGAAEPPVSDGKRRSIADIVSEDSSEAERATLAMAVAPRDPVDEWQQLPGPDDEEPGATKMIQPPWLAKAGSWLPGTVVGGRYRLVRLLGEGGAGRIMLADDLFLQRRVALKTLDRDVAQTPGTFDQFRHEVAIAHAVSHPGLARTFDMGQSDGVVYISMEYLDGESLGARLRRKGCLSLAEVRRTGLAVAAAVHAAHEAGVVHRDLKPSNVQLTTDRGPVVLDFGVAAGVARPQEIAATVGRSELVRPASSREGTPAYMAPEQWRGEAQGSATDIYAFGAILHEMLTGRQPFKAKTLREMMAKHVGEAPPSVRAERPGVPRSLERLVADCLAKDPARRPQSMEAVARRLSPRRWKPMLETAALAITTMTLILAVGWLVWQSASQLMLREMRPAVARLAALVAAQVDGAALAQVKQPGDIEGAPFQSVHAVLEAAKKANPEVRYVYTLRKLPVESQWEFVVDEAPNDEDENGDGVISTAERGSPPGMIYDATDFPQMERAAHEGRALADEEFGWDDWGLLLSGYAPVTTPDGSTCIVGVDVGNAPILRLRRTMEYAFAGLALLAGALVVGLRRRHFRPPGF